MADIPLLSGVDVLTPSQPEHPVRRDDPRLTPAGYSNPIVCEARLTTAYSSLAAGDYLMTGNMTVVSDRYSMWSLVTSNGYRITAPVAGRYDIDWHIITSQTSGFAGGKVIHNAPNGSSNATRVQSYSLLSDIRPGISGSEGTHVHVRGSEVLAANDFLNLMVYSNVTFSMPVTLFGKIRTKVVVRYVGPE